MATNLLLDAACINCGEPLHPMWDDWHEKVVGLYCVFCGLLYRYAQPVKGEWFLRPDGNQYVSLWTAR